MSAAWCCTARGAGKRKEKRETNLVGEHELLLLDGEGPLETVVHVADHFVEFFHVLPDELEAAEFLGAVVDDYSLLGSFNGQLGLEALFIAFTCFLLVVVAQVARVSLRSLC